MAISRIEISANRALRLWWKTGGACLAATGLHRRGLRTISKALEKHRPKDGSRTDLAIDFSQVNEKGKGSLGLTLNGTPVIIPRPAQDVLRTICVEGKTGGVSIRAENFIRTALKSCFFPKSGFEKPTPDIPDQTSNKIPIRHEDAQKAKLVQLSEAQKVWRRSDSAILYTIPGLVGLFILAPRFLDPLLFIISSLWFTVSTLYDISLSLLHYRHKKLYPEFFSGCKESSDRKIDD